MLIALAVATSGYAFGYRNGVDAVNKQDQEKIHDLQDKLSSQNAALMTSENRLKDVQTQLQQRQDAYASLQNEHLALEKQLKQLDNCVYLEKELKDIPREGSMDFFNSTPTERDAYAQQRGRLQTLLATCRH